MNVLAVDVGGTSVKILATGQEERRKFPSGTQLTPAEMVSGVKELAREWKYEVVSIGYPGPGVQGRPVVEPYNLGPGWVAFACPVKVINDDAAMQALGSYKGGKMLFLGLGPVWVPPWLWKASSSPWNWAIFPTRKPPSKTTLASAAWIGSAKRNGAT